MNKHLPGRHDQKKHGRGSVHITMKAADTWYKITKDINLGDFTEAFSDSILNDLTGTDSSVTIEIKTDIEGYRIAVDISQYEPADELVTRAIRINRPFSETWEDVLGRDPEAGVKMNKVFNTIESMAEFAGCNRVIAGLPGMPIQLAAHRDYHAAYGTTFDTVNDKMAGLMVKSAANFLSNKYGIRELTEDEFHRLSDDVLWSLPVKDLLAIKHPGRPNISLFNEYLSVGQDEIDLNGGHRVYVEMNKEIRHV